MSAPPLLALNDIRLRLGDNILFEGATLRLARGDRASLVGRNGSGKTTLMKIIAGLIEPDEGEVFVQPGLNIAYLPQEPAFALGASARDHVLAGGLADHQADAALQRFGIDPDRPVNALSGGESRRVALARALGGSPDVLLLDEPTNHLDLATIEALEHTLAQHRGALLMVSHDRTFLSNVTNRTFWLDRRVVRRRDTGYSGFDQWQEQVLAEEARAMEKLDQKLAEEAQWLHRGVTARRRRNQGRLRRLKEMRALRATLLGDMRKAAPKFEAEDGEIKSKVVIDAKDVAKSYGDRAVIAGFTTRILRGDRIGLIGPNGAGKTTLLRILAGDLEPDRGRVRIARNLNVAYFDQHRAALDPAATLWQTLCPEGGDTVWVHNRPRHVVAYLKDFLFDPEQAKSPVSSLSGGERNRLLLSRILARPSELLVLDEPTNDLDMDTLDMLEDMLGEYAGTLLVVSHDRDFLDRIVTSTIAVEGDGDAVEYPGGYADYLIQRRDSARRAPEPRDKLRKNDSSAAEPTRNGKRQTKLSYKDQRELEQLPDRIAALEKEIITLEKILADPGLYQRDAKRFAAATDRLADAKTELDHAETRWLELEERRAALHAEA